MFYIDKKRTLALPYIVITASRNDNFKYNYVSFYQRITF